MAQNSSVWGFGRNMDGQLGLGHNASPQSSPQQLSLPENMQNISCGSKYSLFLSESGNVYSVGGNEYGQLGIGTTTDKTRLVEITGLPRITAISCGYSHSVFLDVKGIVYVMGYNSNGQLGLGHLFNQLSPLTIDGLPEIVLISCGALQTRCIDKEGVLYCAGHNKYGSLALGDMKYRSRFCRSSVKNIKLLSEGSTSYHCLVKHNDGSVSAFGVNNEGQLGLGDVANKNIPQILEKKFSHIIGVGNGMKNKWKEAAIGAKWSDEDIEKLHIAEQLLSFVLFHKAEGGNARTKIAAPNRCWTTWKEVQAFLSEKQRNIMDWCNVTGLGQQYKREEEASALIKEKEELERRLKEVNERLLVVKRDVDTNTIGESFRRLQELNECARQFCQNEEELDNAFCNLLRRKSLQQISEDEIDILLWKMNLSEYQTIFKENHISGEALVELVNASVCCQIGLRYKDACILLYYREMMMCPGYVESIQSFDEMDCVVCFHNTVERTLELINEYSVPIDRNIIQENKWTTPSLIYVDSLVEFNITDVADILAINRQLYIWKQIHKEHLKDISEQE